jgi:hypothetical protein
VESSAGLLLIAIGIPFYMYFRRGVIHAAQSHED